MASTKSKIIYACTECGAESAKWYGRCPACGAWNSLEEQIQAPAVTGASRSTPVASVQPITAISPNDRQRYLTGMKELDRVLGGGIVRGMLESEVPAVKEILQQILAELVIRITTPGDMSLCF